MKTLSPLLVEGLILFQIFAAARCWAGPASARDENAIRSIIAQMNENWNQHDIRSFMSHYTEDSDTVTRVGEWIMGRTNHEKHLIDLHGTSFRDQLIGRISKVSDVRFITPEVAVVHEIVEEKTGKSIRTYALSKKQGQWKVETGMINVIGNPGEILNRPDHSDSAASANAIIDKAVRALGGAEKLGKIGAITWKTKGTIAFGGNESPVVTQWALQGLDHFRHEFEVAFGGNKIKGLNVVAGDSGWRRFGDNQMDLNKDAVAYLKRHAYLAMIQIKVLPLKSPLFRVEAIGEEKINGKPAPGIQAIGPDGKDFKLYFDKDTGLPLRQVARVFDFDGKEYLQETTFGDYKEMGGIKKATEIKLTRDGERFQEHQLIDFQILDNIDPKKFGKP